MRVIEGKGLLQKGKKDEGLGRKGEKQEERSLMGTVKSGEEERREQSRQGKARRSQSVAR